MKAEELKIVDVLTESKTYIIPSYQRPYSWTDEHVMLLVKDIYDEFDSGIKEYFIGSLICINQGDDVYEVVDGQQRLTTLSLIITKIRDLVSEQKVKDDLQKRVLPIDAYDENSTPKPRLKVRKKEEDLYVNYILQGREDYKPINPSHTDSLFIDNFEEIGIYLKENLQNRLSNFARYILNNVFIIFVQVNNFNSAHRMFNVLNTRGLPLQQSDLIKTCLLEKSQKINNEAYKKIEQYWESIENKIGVENMDKFLTLYEISSRSTRHQGVPKNTLLNDLTNRLKGDFKDDPILFARKLDISADNYKKIRNGGFLNKKIEEIVNLLVYSLPEWEISPPILAYLNKYGESVNFLEFVELFEKCYLHYCISGKHGESPNKFCTNVTANINENKDFNCIKDQLLINANNDYLKNFDGSIYLKNKKLLKYILLKIDQEMQDGSAVRNYAIDVTIEHILPKRMKDVYWTSRFSSTEHEEWVHKLGNLMLISGQKNSQASNGDFEKKRAIYENKRVSFDISKDVLQYKEWNFKSLQKRHHFLMNKVKKIWFVDNILQTSI